LQLNEAVVVTEILDIVQRSGIEVSSLSELSSKIPALCAVRIVCRNS